MLGCESAPPPTDFGSVIKYKDYVIKFSTWQRSAPPFSYFRYGRQNVPTTMCIKYNTSTPRSVLVEIKTAHAEKQQDNIRFWSFLCQIPYASHSH